ncbi:MAG: hypothetical protein M3371_05015 [Acidobacteriota bacterium]|nr:hypothetical protein [Acidobacteriota bacterium]
MVVKESLSNEMISAGEDLIRRLDQARLSIDVALWFYDVETNTWRFMLASPEVRVHGPKWVYKKVQLVVSRIQGEKSKIPLKDITVVDTQDSLISLFRSAIKTVDSISGIRFMRGVINGVFIEDAYIYRTR